ncbi:hypothetical protein [Micromonospora echinospora]|uniref:hypothetical protein n=1 Tax=Micromonospora echinospora TaxID=1877 RepID=UPI0011801DFC|nr:hypothetical protein [Micromonospora echinospora]
MSGERTVAEIRLTERHRPTGFTRHYYGHPGGPRVEVPPPVSLRLVQYAGDEPRVYLFYCDATGEEMTDTLHDSLEDAMDQAKAEFRVRRDEWRHAPR